MCAECGVELSAGWHADHVEPYSKGGETDVINGQALCPRCNLKKGGWMETESGTQTRVQPREWQVEGVKAYKRALAKGQTNFLGVATPGAGKTIYALLCAQEALRANLAERIVVVCPSTHLKTQWADAATSLGLHFDPTRANKDGLETGDYDGVVVTYAQVARAAHLHRMGASRSKTLVILDEIHHAGDDANWGKEIRYAFAAASLRLMLSGTPFRSKGDPMPFVNYEDNKSRADYSYGYAKALADGVCRPVVFPSYDGDMEWWSDGEWQGASFADEVSDEEARRRLATALDPAGKWLKSLLFNADAKLSQVRINEHPDAGGLVISRTQEHARKIARLLDQVTGISPVLAISDDADATENIKRFASGSERWLVAVKMVSEGVDIPRLRVGVYATNVISELFFRQAVGRFVRVIPDLQDQRAYLFIPRDDVLIEYAQTIKQERDHEAREELQEEMDRTREEINETQRQMSLFIAGQSSEAIEAGVYFDGDIFTPEQMTIVRRWREDNPEFAAFPDEDVLRFMLKLAPQLFGINSDAPPTMNPGEESEGVGNPLYRQIGDVRSKVYLMSKRAALVTGREYNEIGWMLKERTGAKAADRTLEQHKECIDVLAEFMAEADSGF